jgi:hypothetical protein
MSDWTLEQAAELVLEQTPLLNAGERFKLVVL